MISLESSARLLLLGKIFYFAMGVAAYAILSRVFKKSKDEQPTQIESPLVSQQTPNVAGDDRVNSIFQSGNKLEAIKLYRELYHASFLEAKAAIEEIEKKRTIH